MQLGFNILLASVFLFLLPCCEPDNQNPCAELLCGIYCENGYLLDNNDCELCECIIYGCLDFKALNYDSLANTDDGSCCYMGGCMDDNAVNYDATACFEDGSCVYSLVFAGVYDDAFNYYEFIPPVEIERVWDDQNIYFQGEYFIDIDLDGNDDIKFNIGGYNQENLPKSPQFFNHCLLTPFNGFEIAYYTDYYPGGLGWVGSVDVVNQLEDNDTINYLSNWFTDGDGFIRMFYENSTLMPFGSWYYAFGIYYIAIKKNNNFGWIEVNMVDGFPIIMSYAIQD